VTEWQPIETAPKDGTVVLLCRVTGRRGPEVHPGAWCPDEVGDGDYPWLFWEKLNASQVKPNGWDADIPTHWMPLPAPPALEEAK
jgi:hypothetical protein